MKRLTTRSIATATAIRDREEFRTSGALRGETHTPTSRYLFTGYLSGPDAERLHSDLRVGIDYVVWSYSTPIAWHCVDGTWHVVAQKFSPTTTKHQGNLYLVREFTVPDWDCETTAYALSDCKHWDKPGTECSGPRVGIDRDGVVTCERHYNERG